MPRSGSDGRHTGPSLVPPGRKFKTEDLDRLSARNWSLVVTVILLCTVGLFAGIFTGMRSKVAEFWPWAGTDVALVVCFSMAVLAFTIYLNRQHLQMNSLRRQLRCSQEDIHLAMQEHCDRLYGLLTVSRTLATATDPQTVLDCITSTCSATFEGEQVSLMLLDRTTNELVVRAATGHKNLDLILGTRTKMGRGVAGWVGEHQKPLVLGRSIDPDKYPGFEPKTHSIASAMVVPIVIRGELIGVLNVSTRSSDLEYQDDDLQALMVFAENAGIACRHAEQSDWMRQTILRLDDALQIKTGS